MMRIKGHKVFEKGPRHPRRPHADPEMGQSEIENELFEQSLGKSRPPSELFVGGRDSRKTAEEGPRRGFSGKSTLLPEDIQEILFNNNQVYVDKPLKEINKLFRDLKQARKMDKIYKASDKTGAHPRASASPDGEIGGLIDSFAGQLEELFHSLQKQQTPDKESISQLEQKLKCFFSQLKEKTKKTAKTHQKLRVAERQRDDDEREIKSLTHILDGSIENLINQDRSAECSIGPVHVREPRREPRVGESLAAYGHWGAPRVGSLFDRMAVSERVYHELGNIKKLNFKLKEALTTYRQKKR